MVDWTKPIETVPDERNPNPVPCRVLPEFSRRSDVAVYIDGPWVGKRSDDPSHIGNDFWWYNHDDADATDWLPKIRNVEEPVT